MHLDRSSFLSKYSSCTSLIDPDMAGRIGLKLGRMVEGMGENVLAKEFF